jgi:hypothetical protein
MDPTLNWVPLFAASALAASKLRANWNKHIVDVTRMSVAGEVMSNLICKGNNTI